MALLAVVATMGVAEPVLRQGSLALLVVLWVVLRDAGADPT
jgi:hypothetical protein